MPGLAIEISAKGVSLSTTTARFIGTFSAEDAEPFITRSVSECAAGIAVMQSETPSIPAVNAVLKLIVTCLSDHENGADLLPALSPECAQSDSFAIIKRFCPCRNVGTAQQWRSSGGKWKAGHQMMCGRLRPSCVGRSVLAGDLGFDHFAALVGLDGADLFLDHGGRFSLGDAKKLVLVDFDIADLRIVT